MDPIIIRVGGSKKNVQTRLDCSNVFLQGLKTALLFEPYAGFENGDLVFRRCRGEPLNDGCELV